ncbi:MAG: Multi-sensor signal transduction histidine kinase [Parcubacteria group bacterium GW2011_GWA1_47_8]|nr:MAG: Multi-sensor signal transduction histidine kinase [Parcubacteria group bacterium GW2011_GWA1_47_8]
MKLRTKASLFLGLIFLIFLTGIIFYVQITESILKTQTLNNFYVIIKQTKETMNAFWGKTGTRALDWTSDMNLQNIVKAILTAKEGTPERAELAKAFTAYVNENKMIYDQTIMLTEILDRSGRVIASTRPERIGTDELKEEIELGVHYFSKTIDSNFGDVFMKGIFFEEDETPEPMVHATVRFFIPRKEGKHEPLDAVLFVHFLSSNEISNALNSDVLNKEQHFWYGETEQGKSLGYKTTEAYAVNRDRIMVTPSRYVKDLKLKQKIDTLPVKECLDNGKEMRGEYDDYRGIRVFGVSSCDKEQGLVLIIEVDKEEIFAPLVAFTKKVLIIGITLLVMIISIVWLFVRRSTARIDEIISVFERVTKDDLQVQAQVHTKDEMGYLAGMLNKMINTIRGNQESLQASKRELEEKEIVLKKDIEEHEKQEKFIAQTERATRNLLEDAWHTKEKFEVEKNRLQTIISSIGDGLIIIDGDYNTMLVNPKAAELLQIPSLGDLLGKDLRTMMKLWKKRKEELLPGTWPTDEMFLTKKTVVADLEDELFLTTSMRTEPLPIVLSAASLGGGERGDVGAVILIRDATEDRELDEAKSGFISVASHQLRTPLTTIRWYSEMLLSGDAGDVSDSQRDFLNEIHGGVERLYQTVDLLLGISRIENGKLKTDKKPIDLGVFTADITKELAPQVDVKKLALTVIPPEQGPVIVSLDALTLRQVVLNIISNAIRYTKEKDTIEIKWNVSEDGKEVVYLVRDNGIGIPEDQRPRIFSKFFRAENARSWAPDGSGLGLSLVKDLIESWSGKVWFESSEGKGTTFFFTIPL